MQDVRGIDVVAEEVQRTLELFLLHKTFKDRMGGHPRRAILFEGPPGTGKTLMAKALAGEANVPFLFVSSSAFQSMYYGQTNRKLRSYFAALRKAAREEGGAIGFIEEIDAIGAARSGMGGGRGAEGVTGVVNELLIQLQSFDEPTKGAKFRGWWVDKVNRWLPSSHQLKKHPPRPANILVVGATNRAADLDPALLRPGRFDRSIFFDVPSRKGREEILAYYLERKAHHDEVDAERVSQLAAATMGYSPAMLENLLNEALVWAVRRSDDRLSWDDIQQAKMSTEIGLAQPVEYTVAERRLIATHEAGHATVAYLVGNTRLLEVLSIIKRKDALGLLAHSASEERFTKTEGEIKAQIEIAFGGIVAEELFFGEVSTGPSGDLEAATTSAAIMVGSLGMAGSYISFDAMQMGGHQNIVAKVLTNDEARAKVDQILNEAHERVTMMLTTYQHVVEALRDALLEQDELIGNEINKVVESAAPDALEVAEASGWRPRAVADRRRLRRIDDPLANGLDDLKQE
jgi:ATP-dependent Zn protease